jgi:hypothetical protein
VFLGKNLKKLYQAKTLVFFIAIILKWKVKTKWKGFSMCGVTNRVLENCKKKIMLLEKLQINSGIFLRAELVIKVSTWISITPCIQS